MNKLPINANSWHWELINIYSSNTANNIKRSGTDLCTYRRTVIEAILVITTAVTVLSIAGGYLLSSVLVTVVGITTNNSDAIEFYQLFITLIASICLLFQVGKFIFNKVNDYIFNKLLKKVDTKIEKIHFPSFITETYKSLKDKYCVEVEIVEQ